MGDVETRFFTIHKFLDEAAAKPDGGFDRMGCLSGFLQSLIDPVAHYLHIIPILQAF